MKQAYLGWSGLSSASSLSIQQAGRGKHGLETVEIDPDVARGLGWEDGETVSNQLLLHSLLAHPK